MKFGQLIQGGEKQFSGKILAKMRRRNNSQITRFVFIVWQFEGYRNMKLSCRSLTFTSV